MGNFYRQKDAGSQGAIPNFVYSRGVVYPIMFGPGEWLEYEIVSASNFQLIPSIAVQQAVSYEIPLCGVYLNGEKVREQVGGHHVET